MYDYDFFVIGAGSGGVRAARVAAALGAKVAVAEERYMGGTCVNVGCIPKKLFAYGAHFTEDLDLAADYGWPLEGRSFDWQTLRQNKDKEIARLNGIYDKLLRDADVTVFRGHAKFVDAHTVDVDGQQYSAKHILVATGGWPWIPDVPGKELAITSNDAFYFETLPKSIAIVGGGYVAVEFASIFNGLGVDTHLIYRGSIFLRGFDCGIREHMAAEFRRKHITLHFDCDVSRIDQSDDGGVDVCLSSGKTLNVDQIMYATGRRPLTQGLGLENTGVKLEEGGAIKINRHYQTDELSIYAIGDVAGSMELTPIALAEGMALANSLFGESQEVDYRNIPTAIFSHPNIATVGLPEEIACELFPALRIYETDFRHLKYTLGDNPERTYMKLVVDDQSDTVLGCHMVGQDAGEIIQGLAVALHASATKATFDRTIGIHPTAAEEFVTMRTVARRYPS